MQREFKGAKYRTGSTGDTTGLSADTQHRTQPNALGTLQSPPLRHTTKLTAAAHIKAHRCDTLQSSPLRHTTKPTAAAHYKAHRCGTLKNPLLRHTTHYKAHHCDTLQSPPLRHITKLTSTTNYKAHRCDKLQSYQTTQPTTVTKYTTNLRGLLRSPSLQLHICIFLRYSTHGIIVFLNVHNTIKSWVIHF